MTNLTHPLTGRPVEVPDDRAADWQDAGWLPSTEHIEDPPADADGDADRKE